MYPCLTQKEMDIQSKSKGEMYPPKKYNEYPITAQSITILSRNWIEMNIHDIKWRIWYKQNMKTCK